jgi:hypothetical protein
MTPNFALGLTEDGITLWYKDTAGWLRVGAVALESVALDAEMYDLAQIAAALAPDGITTKLVIPDAQILFTSLTLPPLPGPEKERAIRAALVGRTPYPVEDLVFDWCEDGAQTHIAVVARETVIEAEDFATTYGLSPVCAVAAPQGKAFTQEPRFCITRTGRKLYPAQDISTLPRDLVREIGMARLPDPEVIIPAAPVEGAKDATALAETPSGAKPAPAPQEPPATLPDTPKAPETSATDHVSAKSDSAPSPSASAPAPTVDKPALAPSVAAPPANATAKTDSPKPALPLGTEPKDAKPLAEIPPATDLRTDPAATFRSRRGAPPKPQPARAAVAKTPKAMASLSSYLGELPKLAAQSQTAIGAALAKLPKAAKSLSLPKALAAAKPFSAPKSKRAQASQPALPKPASGKPAPSAAVTQNSAFGQEGKPAQTSSARKDALATLRERGASKPKDKEAERLTIFGARNHQAAPPATAQNALLILGGVTLLLIAVAVWALYFYTRDPAPQISTSTPAEDSISAPAPDLALEDDLSALGEIEAALGLEDAAQQVPDDRPEPIAQSNPDSERSVPFSAPDMQGGRIAALRSTGVIAPSVPNPLPLSSAPPPPFEEMAQAPLRSELAALQAVPEPTADETALPAPDAPGEEMADSLSARDPAEALLDIDVVEGTPPALPPSRPEGLVPEDVLAELQALAEPSAPEVPSANPQAAPADDAEVVISVTEGRPSVVPPPRPAALAPEAPIAPTEDTSLSPPEGEASATGTDTAANAASPGGIALSALRPQARPETILPVPGAAEAPDAFADASRLAVAASLRPDARPSQFAAVVQRSLAARQAAAAPAATAPAPAPEPVQTARAAVSAVPAIPTSASVAREATQARAINLRQINLIGVMGTPSNRRALVRLSNGNVVTVRVGETLDGGQVVAIGDSELRYIRRGRDVVLRLAS